MTGAGQGGEPVVLVERLRPEHLDDYLALFDRQANTAAAGTAHCYCYRLHLPASIDWRTLTPPQHRAAIRARIEVGEMDGFLAFRDGHAVGWMNAQGRHRLPHCFAATGIAATPIDASEHLMATIACFVVDADGRDEEVTRALLVAGCHSLAARGFKVVEAYPRLDGDDGSTAPCRSGALALFLSEGFTPFVDDGGVRVVRRRLAAA